VKGQASGVCSAEICSYTDSLSKTVFSVSDTNPLSKTLFSVKPLFKRFQRFEKSLYGLKRPIFESELVLFLPPA